MEAVYIGSGSVGHLLEVGKRFSKILLVGDENTVSAFYNGGGDLSGLNYDSAVFPGSPLLIPDENAIARIESLCDDGVDCIIGIGGGTVNDLCKYVAHKHSLYYIYVATAPSMDGYASDGAALILEGMKVTLKARPPHIIICETEILKNAPMELIRAGIGDILGKYSCLNDWLLAKHIKGEYFCKEIYDRVYACTKTVSDNIEAILKRDGNAITLLTDALVQVGIEMSYAGSSRPASGSEHHMAHFFEIYAIEHGQKHRPHGVDVGQASYYTALLRDKLLESDLSFDFRFDPKSHFEKVQSLLPRAAGGIVELQTKTALHGNSHGNYDDKGIKAVLATAPRAESVKKLLFLAGLNPRELTEFYGEETVHNALKYGKELKDRFSVLWLYEYLGWENIEI